MSNPALKALKVIREKYQPLDHEDTWAKKVKQLWLSPRSDALTILFTDGTWTWLSIDSSDLRLGGMLDGWNVNVYRVLDGLEAVSFLTPNQVRKMKDYLRDFDRQQIEAGKIQDLRERARSLGYKLVKE